MHGSLPVLGFRLAVQVHSYAAIALIVLWVFTTFWHFTTGQWRQYLPKLSSLPAVIRFYAWGIFAGAPHPYSKTLKRKQNALQSLAYLSFMVLIGPALWSSGIVYITYPLWANWAMAGVGLPAIALIHTAAAFLMSGWLRWCVVSVSDLSLCVCVCVCVVSSVFFFFFFFFVCV